MEPENKYTNYETVEDYCPVCQVKIFGFDPQARGKIALPNQCQFQIVISNGSVTEIGICKDCFERITNQDVERIFEGIKRYWAMNGYLDPLIQDMKVVEVRRESVW